MLQLLQRQALTAEIIRNLGPVPDPKEWTKHRTGDVRPLYEELAKLADAQRLRDVKATNSVINTARDAKRGEKDVKPGLNFVANLPSKGETAFVDGQGVYRGPHLPVSLSGPLPRVAVMLGPQAFHHGKDGALGTLRHEMKHAEHFQMMIDWLEKWRAEMAKQKGGPPKLDDAGARSRFDLWVDKHKGIGKVERALLEGERKANHANTELLAYVEGFINIFHLRQMTPSVKVAPDYPPALYQLRRAGEEYNRADTSVKTAALARLGDYVKSVLTAQERASLRGWLTWLVAQGKGPPAAGDLHAKLVHNDFKPVEPFLTKALALVP
jgi:hypothetical protein